MSNNIQSSIFRIVLVLGLVSLACAVSSGQRRPAQTKSSAPATRSGQRSATPADGIKQRTIDAYEAYFSVQIPAGQSYVQDLIFQQNEMRRLNLRSVDSDLTTYFRLRDQEFTEAISVLKAFEAYESSYRQAVAQAQYEEERYDIAHSARDEPPDRNYLPTLLKNYNARVAQTNDLQDRIKAKYDPLMNAALKRLSTRYQYPFSSDGSKPGPESNGRPNTSTSSSVSNRVSSDASEPSPAMKRSPRTAVEFYTLGWSYNDQNRYSEAIEPLKSALRLNRNYAEAHTELGYAYRKLNNCTLAIDEYRQAIQLKPESQPPQYGLGWCYDELKRYGDAIYPLRQAVRLNSEFTDAHVELALALIQTQQYNDAIEQCQIAIRQKPEYGLSYYYLGQAHLATGNRKGALEQYRVLQRIDPNNASKLLDEINRKSAKATESPATSNSPQPADPQPKKESSTKKKLKEIWNQVKKPN